MSLLSEMKVLAHDLRLNKFDLMIAGDGSGTVYTQPCGWAAILYIPEYEDIVELFGGANAGTNNFAELSPYLHALWYYHTMKAIVSKPKVSVVSDSELTVRCGKRIYTRTANMHLWAGINWFEEHGYTIQWHHVPRNSNFCNASCDGKAGKVRKALSALV